MAGRKGWTGNKIHGKFDYTPGEKMHFFFQALCIAYMYMK